MATHFAARKAFLLFTPLVVALLLSGSTAQAAALGDPPTFPAYPPSAAPRAQSAVSVAGPAVNLQVDISQREAVRNVYNGLFLASDNVSSGWTGSVANCVPGVTSQTFRDATALRLNVVRALAGVPAAVTLNDTFNSKAQQAALMMSANNQLNHFPPTSWNCFTAEGSEAAGKSNLSLGALGPQAIIGYLEDAGSNNAAVGHRRWLLYPQTQEMGTGDVGEDASHSAANALWVQDSHIFDARPAVRDGFVSWPPPGFAPYPLAFQRWSVSSPNADFSAATVSMSRNGANVPVTLEPVGTGLGENTLVWRPSDALLNNPAAALASADATFTVKVQNIKLGGQAQPDITYSVTLFDPARYGTDTVLPQIAGSDNPASGQNTAYTIAGNVPMADGYDWFFAKASAYATVLGAEGGLAGFTPSTSPGYTPATNEVTAPSGANTYHLLHSQAQSQTLALDKLLVPGSKGALNFDSRLGWATPTEIAAVQVSLDEGNSWQDIYTQAGTDTQGEQAFLHRSLPLDRFAGRQIKLRFNFKQPTGQYYNSGTGVGWYIDNVAFDDTTGLEAPTAKASASNAAFTFNPPTSGQFALAARGTVKTHPLEWGNVKFVNATGTSSTECLFAWAENNYPTLFAPAGSPTAVLAPYTYRHYATTNAYLGVSSDNNHVYYLGPDGVLQDVGPLADWLSKAGCQPPTPPADCLFNWAESNFSSLFAPAGATTTVSAPYTYRHYTATDAYLGVSSDDNHVYYMGPDKVLQDEGLLSQWLPKAGCQ